MATVDKVTVTRVCIDSTNHDFDNDKKAVDFVEGRIHSLFKRAIDDDCQKRAANKKPSKFSATDSIDITEFVLANADDLAELLQALDELKHYMQR